MPTEHGAHSRGSVNSAAPSAPLLLFSYCLAATAGVLWKPHQAAAGGDSPCPCSVAPFPPQAWARALGSGPGDSCAYKAAEAEAGGGPGSGALFWAWPGHPQLLFLLGVWGKGPLILFLGPPLLPCLLPSLSVQRGVGTETTPVVARRPRKQHQGVGGCRQASSFRKAEGIRGYLLVLPGV